MLVTLSTLLRGSVYEKLRWTFKLYDINGDGCITRSELGEIILAIHELMGRRPHQMDDDRKARDQIDRVFQKLDLNQDGVITLEEFMESCLKVSRYTIFYWEKSLLSSEAIFGRCFKKIRVLVGGRHYVAAKITGTEIF